MVAVLFTLQINAQTGVSISSDNSDPDNSAMLDVQSTDKGVLLPRLTLTQRNNITSPATGLMIFQTDNTPGFYYNAGTPASPTWTAVGGGTGTGDMLKSENLSGLANYSTARTNLSLGNVENTALSTWTGANTITTLGTIGTGVWNGTSITDANVDNNITVSNYLLLAGGTLTGNVTTSGLFDGRDVATDGTKLDAIESSADVTDAANVATAGALMDGDFSSNGLLKRTAAGTYSIITDNSTNWNTAYTDRLKWDGGATGLDATTARTSLGLVIGTNVQAFDADLTDLADGTLTATKVENGSFFINSAGTDGQVWTSDGTGAGVWEAAAGGATTLNGLTDVSISTAAAGDVMYHNGTAWVKLAKGTDDQVLTLASGVPSWAAAAGGSSFVGARAYATAGQDIDMIFDQVVFGTENFDEGNNFANNEFTAPTTGYYRVSANVQMNYHLQLWVSIYAGTDGSTTERTASIGKTGSDNVASTLITDIIHVNAGEVIQIWAKFQESDADVTITGTSKTWFSVEKL